MDLVPSCKEKIAHFRLKELKEVLTQLGLSKQGRKQDLVDRILSSLSDEQAPKMSMKKKIIQKDEVAKIIDDAYRKLQLSEGAELTSKVQGITDCNKVEVTEDFDNSICSDMRVRCPCGSTLETDSMIKCEDPGCNTWQHIGCVLIPQEVSKGKLPVLDIFYCELCRLSRADAFLVSVSHPLYPRKMSTVTVPTDGTNPAQTVEGTFQLTGADKQLLSEQNYDIQAWCMLLNDTVPFRMQWPQYAHLQINGIPVCVINRPGSQLLGANGRDTGSSIRPHIQDERNVICLTGLEARIFCFGVRIVKRQTLQEIFNLIPKECDGENIEDSLARIRRCIGGGGTTEADSDSDLEVVAESFAVNLRCPMSGLRIKTAGRFKPCLHIGCFDLEVFVEINKRSRKWQCPICLQNYSLESIIIDPYFNCITSMMSSCEEEITDIEVKQDGSWRVKAKSQIERSRLGDLAKWHSPDGALSTLIEEEVNQGIEASEIKQEATLNGLKVGSKTNNRHWQTDEKKNSVGVIEVPCISLSSSGTGSSYSGENPSVKIYSADQDQQVEQSPSLGAELIILSDSDDDNDILVSSTPIPHCAPSGIIKSGWSVPPEPQASTDSQCLGLGNDSNVPKEETTSLFPDGTVGGNSEVDIAYSLGENSFANDREGSSSLQKFLPSPSKLPREQVNVWNEIQGMEELFPLPLGDGPFDSNSRPTIVVQEFPPEGAIAVDSLAHNESKTVAGVEASSEDRFTFRRQKRFVRQRISSHGKIDEESSHTVT